MVLNISQTGQIAPPVLDVNRAAACYEQLGPPKLYRLGNLTFFACAGLQGIKRRGCIDFRCVAISPAVSELGERGLSLDRKLLLIAKVHDHDSWVAFFKDPDSQILVPMQKAPKGHSPHATTH